VCVCFVCACVLWWCWCVYTCRQTSAGNHHNILVPTPMQPLPQLPHPLLLLTASHRQLKRQRSPVVYGAKRRYIHIYLHTLVHMHTRTYIHTYIHTYIRIHIYTFIHTHTYTHTHIHTYTHICSPRGMQRRQGVRGTQRLSIVVGVAQNGMMAPAPTTLRVCVCLHVCMYV
jgi:hypothetical protein